MCSICPKYTSVLDENSASLAILTERVAVVYLLHVCIPN